MSSPSRRTLPDLTPRSPTAIRNSVVLPAPLWPMIAAPPPVGIDTLTPNRTIDRPYPAVTSMISSIGSGIEHRLGDCSQIDLLDALVLPNLRDRSFGQHLARVHHGHEVGI